MSSLSLSIQQVGQIFAYFIRRHMNKVAERCQEDARKFRITSVPAVTSDWEDLNAVYRRTVYHDALSVVHPSRFYYSVPVCQSCYEIYLFLDELREETILHNPTAPYTRQSQSPASNRRRPRSANDATSQQKLRQRLFRDIERGREDLLNEDVGLLKQEMTSPSDAKQQRKVFITDVVTVHSSEEHKEVYEVAEEARPHVIRPQPTQRVRPASAHAVLTSQVSDSNREVLKEGVKEVQGRGEKKKTPSAPSLVIRADGDRIELVMSEQANSPSTPPQVSSSAAAETSRATAEAIGAIMQRMSPDFSFSSLPFYSSAPFLPIATEDPPAQTLTSSSSKKKNRLYRALSRSRSKDKDSEEEVEGGRGRGSRSRGASFASITLTSPEEEEEEEEGVRGINWDDIISRYERSGASDVTETVRAKNTSVMSVEIPSPHLEGEQGGDRLSSESLFQLSPLDTSAEATSFIHFESSLNVSNSID